MNRSFPFYCYPLGYNSDPTLVHFKPNVYTHDDVFNGKCVGAYFMYIETFNYEKLHVPAFLTPSNSSIEAGQCVIDDDCNVFVDVGANCGFTSYFAYLRGAKKIIAFEPGLKDAKAFLMNNIPNTTLYTFGISNKVGFSNLTSVYKSDNRFNDQVDSLTYTVTMDYLFEQKLFDRIDFIKIDIEGHEYELFEGLSKDNLSKIKNISIELHGHSEQRDDPKLGFLFKEHLKNRLWNTPYFDGTNYRNRNILEVFTEDRTFLYSHIL